MKRIQSLHRFDQYAIKFSQDYLPLAYYTEVGNQTYREETNNKQHVHKIVRCGESKIIIVLASNDFSRKQCSHFNIPTIVSNMCPRALHLKLFFFENACV